MLTFERIDSPESFSRLEAEWDALPAGRRYLPFRTALWNRLWWEHFRRDSSLVRDELAAYTARDGQGRLVAVAPLMLTRRGFGRLPAVRMLQFLGADPNMTELRGVVCAPSDEQTVLPALMRHVARDLRFDWAEWSGVAAATCLDSERPLVRRGDTINYFLELAPTWDEFRAKLPRNIKESLRKCYNAPKRDGLTFELRVVQDPADAADAIGRFAALHAMRAQGDFGVAHRDVFATARSRAFLVEYAGEMARRNQLRVFELLNAGQVIATRIGFLAGREIYLYYSGYDPAFSKYSAMTTVTAEAIQWAIREGLATVNLSFGTDVSKMRWRPAEETFYAVAEVAAGLRANVTYRIASDRLRSLRAFRLPASLRPSVRAVRQTALEERDEAKRVLAGRDDVVSTVRGA